MKQVDVRSRVRKTKSESWPRAR